MKTTRKIALGLLVVLVLIQFIRPEKNIQAVPAEHDISMLYPTPEPVKQILSVACNDCHSNNTRYPWYNNVQPIAWWLSSHVKDGKRHLNFSEFGTYRIAEQNHKMEECIEMIHEGEMPLGSYTWLHKDAKLTLSQQQTLINWCKSIMDTLKVMYPPDSLVMPKRR